MFLIPDTWYKVVTLKKTGRGVFALRDIPAGTVIGDYTGKIIPFDSANEKIDGLYDMAGGSKYDVLADPKVKGVHFGRLLFITHVFFISILWKYGHRCNRLGV